MVYFCAGCDTVIRTKSDKGETWDFWDALYPGVFTKQAPSGYDTKICTTCANGLRNPYLIYIGPNVDPVPMYRRPSKYFRDSKKMRITGLHVLRDIPAQTSYMVYPGPLFDEYELRNFNAEMGYEMTKLYGKGGPKQRGMDTVIMAQLTPAGNPFNAGHFANTMKSKDGSAKRGARYNCIFGYVKVTGEVMARHPEFANQMRLGENYPVVRVMKNIKAGQELILKSYGAAFWGRFNKEMSGKVHVSTLHHLRPHEAKFLKQQKTSKRYIRKE